MNIARLVCLLALFVGAAFQASAQSEVTVRILKSSVPTYEEARGPNLHVTVQPEDVEALRQFTQAHVGEQIEVVLRGEVVSRPKLMEPLLNGQIALVLLDIPTAKRINLLLSKEGALLLRRAVQKP